MSFYSENRCYILHEGDAVFIPPYTVHNASKEANSECTYSAVVFSGEWLWGSSVLAHNEYTNIIYANRYDSTVILRADSPRNRFILDNLSILHKYRDMPVESYELTLRGLLLICFQELYSSCFSKLVTNDNTMTSTQGIQTTLDYIHDHFSEVLTLSKLASVSGYSISHFEHTFKQITGSSPFEYITRIRIINASESLKNSDKKVIDIASENGYDNISYFNRSFKKIMGVSPRKFRNQFKKAPQTVNL